MLLKRWRQAVMKEKILSEVRKRRWYMSKGEKERIAKAKAIRRARQAPHCPPLGPGPAGRHPQRLKIRGARRGPFSCTRSRRVGGSQRGRGGRSLWWPVSRWYAIPAPNSVASS